MPLGDPGRLERAGAARGPSGWGGARPSLSSARTVVLRVRAPRRRRRGEGSRGSIGPRRSGGRSREFRSGLAGPFRKVGTRGPWKTRRQAFRNRALGTLRSPLDGSARPFPRAWDGQVRGLGDLWTLCRKPVEGERAVGRPPAASATPADPYPDRPPPRPVARCRPGRRAAGAPVDTPERAHLDSAATSSRVPSSARRGSSSRRPGATPSDRGG